MTRFAGNPVQVGRRTRRDRDSDDFREFIRMKRSNCRLQRWVGFPGGLDQHRIFAPGFKFAFPPEHRFTRCKDVDARGEACINQRVRQPLRACEIREIGEH